MKLQQLSTKIRATRLSAWLVPILKPLQGQGSTALPVTAPHFETDKEPSVLNNQSGQVVVEYILLLTVGIGIAVLLSNQLVSRNADSPGIITGAWARINNTIGEDIID